MDVMSKIKLAHDLDPVLFGEIDVWASSENRTPEQFLNKFIFEKTLRPGGDAIDFQSVVNLIPEEEKTWLS